jgi:putative Holliday junction resolvase
VHEKETSNHDVFADFSRVPARGRIVCLDIGTKNIGVAVSDETRLVARAVRAMRRANWKRLLAETRSILAEFDASALVLGLPLNFDGGENDMTADVRRLARNYSLSLAVPVFLQDERVTSIAARENLHGRGMGLKRIFRNVDAEAAAIILTDFLELARRSTS